MDARPHHKWVGVPRYKLWFQIVPPSVRPSHHLPVFSLFLFTHTHTHTHIYLFNIKELYPWYSSTINNRSWSSFDVYAYWYVILLRDANSQMSPCLRVSLYKIALSPSLSFSSLTLFSSQLLSIQAYLFVYYLPPPKGKLYETELPFFNWYIPSV